MIKAQPASVLLRPSWSSSGRIFHILGLKSVPLGRHKADGGEIFDYGHISFRLKWAGLAKSFRSRSSGVRASAD